MNTKVLTPIVLFAVVCAAVAVTPARWKHSTEAGFSKGDFEGTVVTSRGEVRLSREVKLLMPSESAPAAVSALAVAGETIYAAAASDNVVYKISGGKADRFATLPGAMVATLVWTGKGLLAGTGGKDAGIYAIDAHGAVKPFWADPTVQYVWAIVPTGKGTLYAATGAEAKVFALDAAGKGHLLYEAGKLAKNILCLARSKAGLLYAGTDEQGLVVEIDPLKKTSRILVDAPEKEVSALVPDAEGGLYVATSDVAKATPDGTVPRNGPTGGKSAGPPAAKPPAKPATKPAPGTKRAPKETNPPAPAKSPTTQPAKRPAAKAPLPRPANSGPTIIRMPPGMRPPSGPPSGPPAPSAKGNAVYYVQPNGLLRTVFRKPVMILAMIRHEGLLLLGTGNGGVIYSVSMDGDDVAQIADTEAKQVTALAVGRGGMVTFGTANKGSVGMFGRGFAKKGTFTSKALDARQVARWGTVQVASDAPAGAKVTLATRSGNVAEPDEKTWSDWTAEMPVDGYVALASPAGRFLQYRLTLTSNGEATPAVGEVEIIYQVGNLAPAIAAVMVQPSSKGKQGPPLPGPQAYRHVLIRAGDPNKDKLVYTVEFRQVGSEEWIKISDKLDEPQYVWDTRTVGDGKYELRITASD